MTNRKDRSFIAYAWVVLGIAARLIPHPANVSPLTSISLFGGSQLGRKAGLALTLATMVVSDLLISYFYGNAPFGLWSIFTYSGFAAIVLAGSFMGSNAGFLKTGGFLTGSSLFFWTWTNFGIWASGDQGLYPRTSEGLVACFTNALPFLQNSLLGDLAWGGVFFLGFHGVRLVAPKLGFSAQRA